MSTKFDKRIRMMPNAEETTPISRCEIIDSGELARRWYVPETWIREYTRCRTQNTIPHIRLGRYVRFAWGSPVLDQWFQQQSVNGKRNGRG
jgi:hypothetical protein